MTKRIFAIGDIHGCAKTFKNLIVDKICIRKSDIVYCVGDYIDRGNDSKNVIDFILELKSRNYQIHTIRGNHEQLLLDSNKSKQSFENWMLNGGGETLRSFGIRNISELNPIYLDFFNQTKHYIEKGNFLIVHAGFNVLQENIFEDKYSMLWIRYFNAQSENLKGKIVIHGHTHIPATILKSQKFQFHINIDGGCVYKNQPGSGSLFALNLNEMKWLEMKNID